MFLFYAPPESARGIDVTSGLVQRFESDGGIGIAAPARALERGIGTLEVPTRREEDAETERRSWMVGRVREFIGTFCAGQVTAPFEQAAEIERAVRVAAFACALIAGLSLLKIAALFEEDPEIDRRSGMTQRICLPICAFGGGQITAFLQPHAEVEPLLRSTRALNRCVCAPRHPQSPVNGSFLSDVTIS